MRDQVLPFYVVCDESYSMADHIDALNQGLRELHRAVGTDPVVAHSTRFCLIGFSSEATVLLPLSRLSEITEITGLSAKGSTNFADVFALLRTTITADVAALKAEAHRVLRPTVFFLSDGQPADPATWPAAHARLTDPTWSARPNVIAFGLGDADAATTRRIGTFRAFMSSSGVSPAAALHEFARALTRSVVQSSTWPGPDAEVVLRVPERVSGFTVVEIDAV